MPTAKYAKLRSLHVYFEQRDSRTPRRFPVVVHGNGFYLQHVHAFGPFFRDKSIPAEVVLVNVNRCFAGCIGKRFAHNCYVWVLGKHEPAIIPIQGDRFKTRDSYILFFEYIRCYLTDIAAYIPNGIALNEQGERLLSDFFRRRSQASFPRCKPGERAPSECSQAVYVSRKKLFRKRTWLRAFSRLVM